MNPLIGSGASFFRAVLAALVGIAAASTEAIPAFPGAEGFGRNATGGRGGSVYVVTNLNDSGPGSFRDAVSQPNRYVVFAVGGVIRVTSRVIVSANLTIAGQTAPGQGITIYGNGLSFSNANNTVTRYIRVRMGVVGDSGADAMGIAEGHDMLFDHVSASWGRDETFSVSGNTPANITIQDCIIAQGLETHSCGGLIQTDGGVSILRTLYVDNDTRNPKVKGVNEFVNNVIYNWGDGGGYILGDSAGPSFANVIENYFIKGPSTLIQAFTRGNLNFHIFASNNYYDANLNGVLDGAVVPPEDYTTVDFQGAPYPYFGPTLFTAAEAYDHVVARAGASRARDSVDTRLVTELTSLGTLGQLINNENMAPMSGPGVVLGGRAPQDTDGDGMPNAWELATGGNPLVADHNGDLDGNGYTNLEDYLNALAPASVQKGTLTGISSDTGVSPSDGVTSDNALVLSGTAEAGASVAVTRVGTGVIGTVTADGGGLWSLDLTGTTLADGPYAFTAVVTTSVRTWTPIPALMVTVDTAPPAAASISSVVLGANLVVSGTSEPGGEAEVTLAELGLLGRTTVDEDGLWTLTYVGAPLAPGVHTFTAVAFDKAGNAGPASPSYVVDTSLAAPVIAALADDTGSSPTDHLTKDTSLILNGTAPAGTTVVVTRVGAGVFGSTSALLDGTWVLDASATPLPAGAYTFIASALDGGGNSSPASASFAVTIDTAAPTIALVRQDPATAATVAPTVTYRVNFNEAVEGVDLNDFNLTRTGATLATLTSVTPLSGQSYDVVVTAISGEGTLRLDLKATGTGIVDVAGNAIAAVAVNGQVYTIRAAGSSVWASPESGVWSDALNWQDATIANGASATADFAVLDPTDDVLVHSDSPRTIGNMLFGDTDLSTPAAWWVDDNGNPVNALTLAGSPTIMVGPLTAVPMVMSPITATIAAQLQGTAGFTKTGLGTLVLTTASPITGPMSVGSGTNIAGGTLRLAPGASLSVPTLTVAGNITELNIAGGALTVAGATTMIPRNSAITISSGSGTFNGGISNPNNVRDPIIRITGGTLSASSVIFPRSSDNPINFGTGLLIQGGTSTIGTIGLGTVNSWGAMSVENGTLTVTGPITVGHQVTAGRGGGMRVLGGTLVSSEPVNGIILSRNPGTQPNNVSTATFTGGVSTVEKFTLGFDATSSAGSATLTVNGGALYMGAGGIVKNGTAGMATTLAFSSGILGAKADWTTSLPITLPTGGNIAIKTADPVDVAHDVVLGGVLSGEGGLVKTGAGRLTLTAANTFTGPVSMNAGTLRVDGSLASTAAVAVGGSATLLGNGTVAGAVSLNAGGTIAAPGPTPPALLTLGSLTWNGGGTLAVDLSSGNRVVVTGALAKGSAGSFMVALSATTPPTVGSTFTLATYASTTFAAGDLSYSGLPGYLGLFVVGPTALQFVVTGAGPTAEYTHWAYTRLPPGQRGATDDPDGDGGTNLLEFVVGTDPAIASADGVRTTTVSAGGSVYPAVLYRRRQNLGGVTVAVLVSSVPQFVTSYGSVEVSAVPLGNGMEEVVARSTLPLVQHPRQAGRLARPTQYFRVSATLPAE